MIATHIIDISDRDIVRLALNFARQQRELLTKLRSERGEEGDGHDCEFVFQSSTGFTLFLSNGKIIAICKPLHSSRQRWIYAYHAQRAAGHLG